MLSCPSGQMTMVLRFILLAYRTQAHVPDRSSIWKPPGHTTSRSHSSTMSLLRTSGAFGSSIFSPPSSKNARVEAVDGWTIRVYVHSYAILRASTSTPIQSPSWKYKNCLCAHTSSSYTSGTYAAPELAIYAGGWHTRTPLLRVRFSSMRRKTSPFSSRENALPIPKRAPSSSGKATSRVEGSASGSD